MSELWTKKYWADVAERAVRTFAQALVAMWEVGQLTDLADVDWVTSASVAGMAALLSVLMSVGAGLMPAKGNASFLPPRDGDPYDEPESLGEG